MTSSPTVWLRWLSHEMSRLRKEAGLERAEVAKAIRCSPQKIGHLETAVVAPKVRDLEEILLPMYHVPEERWPFYLQAAKDARKKGWWESHADALPSWFSLFVGLEQGASELHVWNPQLVHGLLQTEDYAAAAVRGGSPDLADAEVDKAVEVRLARQKILDAKDAPRLWFVVGESALRANFGGRETMRGQLEHLHRMAGRPRITVQVLPQDVDAHPGIRGPFTVMGFPTEGDPGLVYIEYHTGSVYLEEPREVKAHQIDLEHLRGLALSPAASRKRIAAIAKE
ncbi:helix-turn-helix domain-containing protein [Amycolatopsis sp. NPDC059027]|uniref:helix-turn-helix domain-containing protein n=1 Tax=unclassified Amycolatopsis TaxID=2618356 RepID=UPI00366C9F80